MSTAQQRLRTKSKIERGNDSNYNDRTHAQKTGKRVNCILKTRSKDARYGDGQYLSDIIPGTRTPSELSYAFLRVPFQGRRFTNYVEIDVSGLRVIRGRDSVFVIPNSESLNLSERIISGGTP
ncbi:MAG: HYD1 signature containing ADP-ribosyltransferase family protein [Pirellulaceae bacterium]